ncbi:MAG: NUDIX domain-containing protein [Chromatiales bacterium]|nr:NUDIX domain-containing protein [Chromatiales bacterium]
MPEFEILSRETAYQGFFRVNRYRLRHSLFGGGWSEPMMRELLERGHAVAVLLYDPLRDEVVLVEQFRIGALDLEDGAWMLEVVMGIIDDGESLEEVAVRESIEEAGCEIRRMEFIADFVLSPGGCSERMYLFVGEIDSSSAGGVFGLPHEGEDIRAAVYPADEAIALLGLGKIRSATPVIALQWLALHREELRERWGVGES